MSEEQLTGEQESNVEEVTVVADPGQTPIRIDKFLHDKLQGITRNKIQNAIKAGSVEVNGEHVKSNYKVRPNDRIHVIMPKTIKWGETIIPQDIPLDIRYEDDDLMVIHKPAGLVVHPGVGNHDGTLVNALAGYFGGSNLPTAGGNSIDRMGLVHRLDKDTSGLLVIGKTEFALSHLAQQFFKHTIDREYLALVWGEPDPEKATIQSYLGRSLTNRTQYTVVDDEIQGKHAITHYETHQQLYYVSLIKCKLETGRTHQIRVHMKHQGHPIFNDEKYGGDKIVKGTVFNKYKQFVMNCFDLCKRQALHARFLGFTHPVSGERMEFEAEMPDDMKAVVAKWQSYIDSRKELIG